MLEITASLAIPEEEVTYVVDRSSGPGGQHVNKVSTRVTLLFDLEASSALSAGQKARIRVRLGSRITKAGVLRVTCQKHRSQSGNKERARERFAELLRDALRRQPVRRKTQVPRAAKEKRIGEKTRRSDIKKTRSSKVSYDE